MEKGWSVALTTGEEYFARMACDLLETEEIRSVILNQRDSSYTSFGEIELWVRDEDLEKAKEIISNL